MTINDTQNPCIITWFPEMDARNPSFFTLFLPTHPSQTLFFTWYADEVARNPCILTCFRESTKRDLCILTCCFACRKREKRRFTSILAYSKNASLHFCECFRWRPAIFLDFYVVRLNAKNDKTRKNAWMTGGNTATDLGQTSLKCRDRVARPVFGINGSTKRHFDC